MAIQSACRDLLPLFDNLSLNDLIVSARAGDHGITAVGPELPLGPKTMGRADGGYQLRHADRAKPRQFDQDPVIGVGSRLRQEPLFSLLAQLR